MLFVYLHDMSISISIYIYAGININADVVRGHAGTGQGT